MQKDCQDSATAHTADRSMRELQRIFGTRLISNNLWVPQRLDLTPCDFYLWGILKGWVYRKDPHSIDELRDYICQEIEAIRNVEFQCSSFVHQKVLVVRGSKCGSFSASK